MRVQAVYIVLLYILMHPFASAQWVCTTLDSNYVRCLAVSGSNLFAGKGGFQTGNGIFRSVDSGATWSLVAGPEITGDLGPVALAVSGTNVFASGVSIYRSTDNGTSWLTTNSGLPSGTFVFAFAVAGAGLFVGSTYGVFVSTDDGASWLSASSGLPTNLAGCIVGAIGGNLVAGVQVGEPSLVGYFYSSTINGASWTVVNPVLGYGHYVRSFSVMVHTIFAGTNGGKVFRSTDSGLNWAQLRSPSGGQNLWALGVSDTNLFAGGDGVFLSTDNGTSWTQVSSGLPDNLSVSCLAVSGLNLFAGTDSGVWRRPLSEMITDVESSRFLPTSFVLDQNYPNPFNPSTTIRFELPKSSVVRLTVFDILGREISVLVNERRNAGVHEVKFDGSNLASGVYFYRLQAGSFAETKKLMILK